MTEFEGKKKALFDCLDAAEKTISRTSVNQYDDDFGRSSNLNDRKEKYVDKYKNKKSLFKRPDLPISKCLKSRRQPDHQQNPDRYTHYSLSEVTDTSDRMNSTAAFNFLREMEERRMQGCEDEEMGSDGQKIVFKNSKKLAPIDEKTEPSEKRVKGNKFVMPEYVIGGEKKPKQQAKKERAGGRTSSNSKQLKLTHLEEEEECE